MIWSLVIGILISLLVVEFTDWCPSIAAGLVRLAARLLPAADRDRYHEEWLAEVEAVPGRIVRIIKATCLLVGVPAMRLVIAHRARRQPVEQASGLDSPPNYLSVKTSNGRVIVFVDNGHLKTLSNEWFELAHLYRTGKSYSAYRLSHHKDDDEDDQSSPR